MVDKTEESVCFGGVQELGDYLVDAGVEVVERDFGYAAVGVLCWGHDCGGDKVDELLVLREI